MLAVRLTGRQAGSRMILPLVVCAGIAAWTTLVDRAGWERDVKSSTDSFDLFFFFLLAYVRESHSVG